MTPYNTPIIITVVQSLGNAEKLQIVRIYYLFINLELELEDT